MSENTVSGSVSKTLVEAAGGFSFHSIPVEWRDTLVVLGKEHGVELEPLQYRLTQVCRAELGKLQVTGSKTGVVTLSKGCLSGSVGSRNAFNAGGKSAHQAIRFVRECQAATAYLNEFGAGTVNMTDGSARFIADHAERLAGEFKAKADEAKAKAEAEAAKNGATVNA